MSDTVTPYWSGYAGHFVSADKCMFHLHTRVGPWRISTVGDYRPDGPSGHARQVGSGRMFETMVFRVDDADGAPEGKVVSWSGEYPDWLTGALGYNDSREAEAGHHAAVAAALEAVRTSPEAAFEERVRSVVAACSADGWDSYGARAVGEYEAEATLRLAAIARDYGMPEPRVVPTPRGRLVLVWGGGCRAIEAEVIGDEVKCCVYDDAGHGAVWSGGIADAAAWVIHRWLEEVSDG